MRYFAIFDFVYTLTTANIDQSVPNLATIYMPIRSQTSSIMGQIKPEHQELLALEFGNIGEYDFVYTLSSTIINQSSPNLVKKEWDHKIWDELENLPYLTLFTL